MSASVDGRRLFTSIIFVSIPSMSVGAPLGAVTLREKCHENKREYPEFYPSAKCAKTQIPPGFMASRFPCFPATLPFPVRELNTPSRVCPPWRLRDLAVNPDSTPGVS